MIPWPSIHGATFRPFLKHYGTYSKCMYIHWLILAHLHQNIHHGWWWRWHRIWWALGPVYLSPLWSLAYFSGAVSHVHQLILWNPYNVIGYHILYIGKSGDSLVFSFQPTYPETWTCRNNIPGKMRDSRWPCLYFVCVYAWTIYHKYTLVHMYHQI